VFRVNCRQSGKLGFRMPSRAAFTDLAHLWPKDRLVVDWPGKKPELSILAASVRNPHISASEPNIGRLYTVSEDLS
jgi:hypothetical protein